MVYIVKTVIGIFVLDDNRKIILFKRFPKDASVVASKLTEEEPEEFRQIKNEMKNVKSFITTDKESETLIRFNLRKYTLDYNFAKDQIEFNRFLTEVNSELAKQKIKETASRDSLIVHVNNAIEELDKTANLFVERLREWYSLHFPEMDRIIEDHATFVNLVQSFGNRKNFNDKRLSPFKEKSSGMEFNENDVNYVKLFASDILGLYKLRESLSTYLSSLLVEIAPNLSAIAGDVIAAKLISKAGGLDRLAKMPSSTIQLLGSEKALFRFLKSKGRAKSPKFGLIFNHPLIQNAPREKQGKIARLVASKLSIAIRIDFYSKEYKSNEMKKDLENKVKEILTAKE